MNTRCAEGAQTNNPRKIAVLEELGVVVMERIPCLVQAQEHSLGYLTTKQVPCMLVPPARHVGASSWVRSSGQAVQRALPVGHGTRAKEAPHPSWWALQSHFVPRALSIQTIVLC